MRNDDAKPLPKGQDPVADSLSGYAPKEHTLREQIVFGLKFGICAGLFLLAIWLVEH
ncbi:MAG: hypothetical protein V3571_12040 [Pseudodesulfovibrio sp.]